MTGRRDNRAAPALVLAALAAAGLALAALAVAHPAVAHPAVAGHPSPSRAERGAATSGPLEVSIDSLAPVAPRPAQQFTVAGIVRNTGAVAVTGLQVQLAVGAPLASRAELDRQRLEPTSERVVYGPVRVNTRRELGAGAQAAYTITLSDASRLGLAPERVTGLAVQAVGAAAGPTQLLGEADTTLSWFPAPIESPVHVALIVPVTAPPGWLPDSSAVAPDDAFVASLAPDGRLGRLLLAGEQGGGAVAAGRAPPEVTLAVDPALVRRVAALGPPAGTTPPPGTSPAAATVAREWLARLRDIAAAPGVTVSALPAGDADLASLAAGGPAGTAQGQQLLRAAPGQLGEMLGTTATTVRLDPVLPVDGILPRAATDLAVAAGARVAVVSSDQLPAPPVAQPATPTAVSRLPGGAGSLAALVTDPRLQQLLALADGRGSGWRLAEQDLLGELALITSEAPNLEDAPGRPQVRAVVLEAPRDWSPGADYLRALGSDVAAVPWAASTALASLPTVAAPGPTVPARVPAAIAPVGALPGATLTDLTGLRDRVAALADLPPPASDGAPPVPETRSPPLAEALDRASSAWWRTDPGGGAALRDRVRALVDADLAQVVLGVNRDGVRLTGASGVVPVQLSNGLPEDVLVELRLRAEAGDKVLPVSPRFFLRSPRGAALVQQQQLTVTARSTGRTRTTLQLFTKGGRPIGEPKRLVIQSTAYGVVAVGITAGALTVLVLAFIFRGFRWVRRRRSTPGEPSAPSTAS